MPLIIESYEPPWRITPWFHKIFAALYLLLFARFVAAVYEGPQKYFTFRPTSPGILLLKRASGVLDQPFFGVLMTHDLDSNAWVYGSIVLAISVYAFIHYGMTMKIFSEGRIGMADRILKICKAIFFLLGSLMLLLIVLRMGVMLYDDMTIGRGGVIIGAPLNK